MTRSNDKKPPPAVSPGAGRAPDRKPGRGAVTTETFGRFVGNLARLEGGGDRKGKEGKR
jgi:hypothetical protein